MKYIIILLVLVACKGNDGNQGPQGVPVSNVLCNKVKNHQLVCYIINPDGSFTKIK